MPKLPNTTRKTASVTNNQWRLLDAKTHFSELVRRVRSSGPQQVSVRGKVEVVVISVDDYRRLSGTASGQSLVDALQSSPHRDIEIEPSRAPMPVRGISL